MDGGRSLLIVGIYLIGSAHSSAYKHVYSHLHMHTHCIPTTICTCVLQSLQKGNMKTSEGLPCYNKWWSLREQF